MKVLIVVSAMFALSYAQYFSAPKPNPVPDIIFNQISRTGAVVQWVRPHGDFDEYVFSMTPPRHGIELTPAGSPHGTAYDSDVMSVTLSGLKPRKTYTVTVHTQRGYQLSWPTKRSFRTKN